ncbi:hypothetical protein SL003B_1247 [Polymorphum gilvum SL003B-26A1]|uniref:Uncharacterized protein n=1 Tax=Polymorphum gilvum (strain LMG 25793 / CGMCC 1.9160 / SL003B-26A1) TaxID=991905 RepID=F2J0K8_POLGS|nr:hypothetical protein SL003B_1247 [Polymorphum gilvum SL003B-26A1]
MVDLSIAPEAVSPADCQLGRKMQKRGELSRTSLSDRGQDSIRGACPRPQIGHEKTHETPRSERNAVPFGTHCDRVWALQERTRHERTVFR